MNIGDTTVQKRVYLGGLASSTTELDLMERFSQFGQITSIELARDSEGITGKPKTFLFDLDAEKCRGFGHFDFTTSEIQWRRLVSAYNGSLWRGQKLRIEEARPTYLQKLASSPASVPQKRIRKLIRFKSCGLMTDAQAGSRKGWKKGRYGRAIAFMRIRRPDRTLMTVDPAHYKERIQKLFGSVKPLPITKLTWSIQDDKDEDETVTDVSSGDEDAEMDRKSEEEREKVAIKTSTAQDCSLMMAQLPSENVRFSLGNLLGLGAEPAQCSNHNADQNTSMLLIGSSLDIIPEDHAEIAPLTELLFDPVVFESLSLDDYAFCRRSGREEAYLLWKGARKNLRLDFKQRIKQAKKLIRRKSRKK